MRHFLCFIIILSIFYTALPQEYTLDELISIAAQNSLNGINARNTRANAVAALRSSYFSFLPSASLSYSNSLDYDADDDQWYDNTSFTLSKALYLNDPDLFNVLQKNLDNKNANLNLKGQQKQIAFDVLSLYLDVLIYKTNHRIFQNNLKTQQKVNEQTYILYENGNASLLDLKQSEISLLDYTIAVKEAEISLARSRKALFAYLNIKDEGYEIIEYDFSTDFEPGTFQNNLELNILKNNIKKSRWELFRASLDFLPDVSLDYSLKHSTNEKPFELNTYNRPLNQIGIYASYDICSLFTKRENYSVSLRDLNYRKQLYEYSRQELEEEIAITNDELHNLVNTRDMYYEKLTMTEQNLELAQLQYELGTIGLIDLDKVIIDLQDSRMQYYSRFYEFVRKREKLNLYLSGNILGKW